jgi:hypothetical protein
VGRKSRNSVSVRHCCTRNLVLANACVWFGNLRDIARGGRVLVDGAVHAGQVRADVIGFFLDPKELSTAIRHRMRAPRRIAF